MNYNKQIAKIAKFLGCKIIVHSVKIQENNTVKIKFSIDGGICRFHLAESRNKYVFRELFLIRWAEMIR